MLLCFGVWRILVEPAGISKHQAAEMGTFLRGVHVSPSSLTFSEGREMLAANHRQLPRQQERRNLTMRGLFAINGVPPLAVLITGLGSDPRKLPEIRKGFNGKTVKSFSQVWSFSSKRQRDLENIERSLPDFEELSKDDLQQFLDLELESTYDFEEARHYEIMFLVHEDNFNDVPAVIKKVEDFIAEKKGKLWRLNDWGLRRLAYKIKKASKANYLLMNIEISSQAINELNTLLEKDERVIRHMCITQKEAITAASEPPPDYFPESEAGDDDYDSEYDSEDEEGEEEEEEGESVAVRTV